jgi:peptidoglycan hydrolase-like protein with peptidoglycan-binding domain
MTPQFRQAVSKYGPRLKNDLDLELFQAAAFFGNFAVESDQFRALQEYKPVVAGSRGGWGWAQWTGPRRRLFEAFAKSAGLKLDDPEAFYAFLIHELEGPERGALQAVRKTTDVDQATETVMKRYERPGVPHLDKRKRFAQEALEILESTQGSSRSPLGLLGLGNRKNTDETTKGDPTVYRVQSKLKALGYYRGLLDGIEGRGTRKAVSEAREDHGLEDGGIDGEFLEALETMSKAEVSESRKSLSLQEAKDHDPEAFQPTSLMTKVGMGATGLGGVSATGALDKVSEYADQAQAMKGQVSNVADAAQMLSSPLLKPLLWAAQHPMLILIVLGVILSAAGYFGARKIHAAMRNGKR